MILNLCKKTLKHLNQTGYYLCNLLKGALPPYIIICFVLTELWMTEHLLHSSRAEEVFPQLEIPLSCVLGGWKQRSGENQKLLECPCSVPSVWLMEESPAGGQQGVLSLFLHWNFSKCSSKICRLNFLNCLSSHYTFSYEISVKDTSGCCGVFLCSAPHGANPPRSAGAAISMVPLCVGDPAMEVTSLPPCRAGIQQTPVL